MNLSLATKNIHAVPQRLLDKAIFVRAYDTRVKTLFHRNHFFDCVWSRTRGYRYNFRATHPVLYLAGDHLVASSEIGPRTRVELLVPHLNDAKDPYLYVTIKVTAAVLDLTDRKIRKRLGLTLEDLLVPTWDEDMKKNIWAPTHHIGKLALDSGRFAGILYPSYTARRLIHMSGKQCVAIFMEPSGAMSKPLHASTKLEVVDPQGILAALGLIF